MNWLLLCARLFIAMSLPAVVVGCNRSSGPTHPHSAALNGDAFWLGQWLEAGGDPNAIDEYGYSLLDRATGPKGSFEVTEVLLRYGADPNRVAKRGYSPLMNAASGSMTKVVHLLLEYGADICYQDGDGKNAYKAASSTHPNDRELVWFLADQIEKNCPDQKAD